MILFRYICREIYLCLLVITLILIAIFVTNDFSRYLEMVAAGQLTIGDASLFTALQLSAILTYLLPFGLFLSILITLGRMYADNEMTVMSACGMSLLRQVTIVMGLSLVVAIFAGWLSFWLNPMVKHEMSHLKERVVDSFQVGTIIPHRFEAFGDSRVIYADDVFHLDNKAKGLFLAFADPKKKGDKASRWEVIIAKSAHQTSVPGVEGKFIVVDNGTRYSGEPGSGDYTASQFQQYGVNVNSTMVLGDNHNTYHASKNVQVLGESMSELWHKMDADLYADAEFQLRLSVPISILIAALIAIGLAKVDPRQGRFYSLIPAIILYLAYASLIFLSRNWLKRGVIPRELGMWWIHLLMLGIAAGIFANRVGWRRIRQLIWRPAA